MTSAEAVVIDREVAVRRGAPIRQAAPGGRWLAAPEPLSVAPDAAPARESADRVEIAPAAADAPARLTLLGVVRDARGRAIENFGIRGIRKDASNAFAEERVWDVAFHAGGEFALVELEPHAWELAPFADGCTLERSERFVRSNARAVVFRMKSQVEIAGVVIDSASTPVAGAKVRTKEQSARDGFPATWETTSDRAGRFQLTLDVGEYMLRAACDGYAEGEEQRIEVEHLQAQRHLELRLADGCSVRIVFDRTLGVRAPGGAMAGPIFGDRGPQLVALGEGASEVTIRGLAPGWHRLVVSAGGLPHGGYMAAVELELGSTLEARFEARPAAPVAVQFRPSQPGAAALDSRRDYEILPTLPNLNWLALSRPAPGDDRDPTELLWSSANEWNAPAPGSYVVFPKRLSSADETSFLRFEAPHAPAFELELAPREPDPRSRR
jgi:hypothetical protein